MGVRSTNPLQSFIDDFYRSGTDASGPNIPVPFTGASGGVINNYEDSGTFYRAHIFTASGSLVVSDPISVDILAVGGGGGSGRASGNGNFGGAGAGGMLTQTGVSLPGSVTCPITIGAGGADCGSTSSGGNYGANGVDTAFTIPTGSMEKTMRIGDYLFVNKMKYGAKLPQTPLSIPFVHNRIPGTYIPSFVEWFKLDYSRLPGYGEIKINDIIRMRVRGTGQSTKGFIIVAANDLSGPWTKVTEQTDIIWKSGALGESKTFHFENDTYYKYYGIIITHALQVNGYPTLSNMEFSGTIQRKSQSVFHDGKLTLTKNLDVSRIGPALDVDNTPRRDRLIAEFNTSTNPTFEGAVRDTSGRGNDGTLQGGATYDANEKAITFDGSGDYIRMCDWHYGTGFVHSFSGWVKIKSPEESWTVVYGVGDASSSSRTNFTIWALTNSNKFRSEADATGGYIDHTFEFTGKLDQWMHVAVVKSDASIVSTRMYINGEILPQGAGSNQNEDIVMPNSPQNFNVGSYAPSPGSDINADYSNIKFYDCALTAEEVKALYNMGRCDEGHHTVNFSKTRVGIGLGDGETARSTLDVRGTFQGNSSLRFYVIEGNHPDPIAGQFVELPSEMVNGEKIISMTGVTFNTNGDAVPFERHSETAGWEVDIYYSTYSSNASYNNKIVFSSQGANCAGRHWRVFIVTL
jgi:hypothetical protein